MWECPDLFRVSTNSLNGVDTSAIGPNIEHLLKADVEISFKITDLEKAEMLDSSWTNPQLLCSRKINHSTVESFGVGGKACITARVYPILATDDRAQRYAFNYGN
ncbi:hypothetical protein KPL71_020317 [Citrus sinensis]|uniref:Uncharacterized protein n=1 Tax=Citrus sinensis TaxID=2711 RepID=A0ACB8J8W7_CITSI|nr:hypothetical protein KPL71_020317 [Citrus sinensis]